MTEPISVITNVADAPEEDALDREHWGNCYRVLTPTMRGRGGRLGVAYNRMPPGRAGGPFHWHQREDEVFFVMSGAGVLRYGDRIHPIREGDCIECPAGTGIGHQIANTGDVDLCYLSIGPHDPDEVCGYPDTGKVYVRSVGHVGWLQSVPYMQGEPEVPPIFEMAAEQLE